jgi:putative ABC transport system permease protein
MRAKSLFRRDRVEKEFAAELDAHLALHIEDGMRAGLSENEARRQALIKLGGAEQVRQANRDNRSLLWLENFAQDVRYGVRTLRRSPGFTVTAVLTLGLGIGACTAIFSMVNAVLIRSLPYGDPERLVYLFTPNPNLKIPAEVICPSYGDFYDIKRESRLYAGMSNFEQVLFSVGGQGSAQRLGAARVDESFFTTLESQPDLGRAIGPDNIQPGHDKVAVISHSLWVSMFAAKADVLGRDLQLDGAHYRIIGVMPPEFEYPFKTDLPYGEPHIKSTQIWVPLVLDAKKKAARDPDNNVSIARLRPGVSMAQAQSEMSTIMARLDKQYAGETEDFKGLRQWGALFESFTGISIGPVRPLMRLLLVSVGLVLLIACGNAANLLLARAAARERELGVRAALGAGRSRMMRQLLTESLLICLGGGVLGIGLAFLFLRILPRLDPGNIPRLNEASLDFRVLLFALAASLLTGVITGGFPAIGASRLQLTESLKAQGGQGRMAGHSRLQSGLIVMQTSMVVVLLAAAGLLIRSYINVVSVDTGFSQAAVTFHLALDDRYKPGPSQSAFFKDFIARLSALPGVQAVGAVNDLPLTASESITLLWIDGYPNKDFQQSEGRTITPQYFSAMNIPLIAGRSFTDADTAGNRPTIINKKFADTYFPNQNPIGRRISTDDKRAQWATIVGVVADVRHTSLEEEPQPQIYNAAYDFGYAYVAVRSTQPPAMVVSAIRSTLKSIDPNLALTDVQTMGDLVSHASARRRFQTSLLSAFAGIALVLALVGLYGLMAYSVTRRTREVGIRMALGAQRSDVLLLVLKNAGFLVSAGLVAGLVCAWIAARTISSFLFGVSAHDPMTIAVVSALLMVCGLLAAFVPARRASSTDPMRALRTE